MRLIRLAVPVSLAAFLQLTLASVAWAQPPAAAPPPAYPPAAAPPPAYPAASPGPAPAGPPPATTVPAPGPAPAYPPGTGAGPSPYPPGVGPTVYGVPVAGPVVTLQANTPRARLQQMQLKWRDICTVPCGIPVDPNVVYRVGGGALRPSDPFRMPRSSGPVLIDADVGSNVKYWVGFGLGLGGLGTALGGLLYLANASSTNTNLSGTTTSSDVNRGVGIAYLIIGGILMAIGIPMWAGSNTSVQIR